MLKKLALALAAVAISCAVAHAQVGPPPPPPPPPPAPAAQQQNTTGNGNAVVGQAAVVCMGSAAGSTMIGAAVQGHDLVDPRDMTGNEAAWKMGGGCPVFLPLAIFYPPDNDGTRQVARLTSMWRKTPQGQMLTQFCMRGQEADGCSNGMEVFWSEEEYAYRNGNVRDSMRRNLQLQGILVTQKMVKQSEHPLGQKTTKVAHHRRH